MRVDGSYITDDDGDVFIECKCNVPFYSKDPMCRAEWNRRTTDCDCNQLIKLCNLLTCASDNSFFLGWVEKKVVSDMPYGDCIGACTKYRHSGWCRCINDRVQLCVVGKLVVPYSEHGDEVAD